MGKAEQIVEALQHDLNDRRGFDLTSLDEDIEQEITAKWVEIVDGLLVQGKQRTGMIEVARSIDGMFHTAPDGSVWDNVGGCFFAKRYGELASIAVCARSMRGLGLKRGEGPVRVELRRVEEKK